MIIIVANTHHVCGGASNSSNPPVIVFHQCFDSAGGILCGVPLDIDLPSMHVYYSVVCSK